MRKSKDKPRTVAVVGGGWAGCAAAVELARLGHHVTLFEAARTLGGRARVIETDGRALDNGQHILLGAYGDTLKLMKTVGLDPARAMLRLPLQMRYPWTDEGMDFLAPRLPAPLHMLVGLLRTKGLAREDKMALARFTTTARWMDWRMHEDCSVTELLERYDQTERLVKLMWRPLCVAALNTPPERASAQVFLNVLRDSLGARRHASDMLIPRLDLNTLFPRQAASFIEARGGVIKTGCPVKSIVRNEARWIIEAGSDGTRRAEVDAVVVATPPAQAAALLKELIDVATLAAFEYEPITTCYLQYDSQCRLPRPFYALVEDGERGDWGQFVFDRGQLDESHAGLMAVVVSSSGSAIAPGHDALAQSIISQLARNFGSRFAKPSWSKVISEKRATFSCTPGLQRPGNATALEGLVLAGDYTASDYPATLESAIRSGVQAARLLA